MVLIIAEKPSLARNIMAGLGQMTKKDGYFISLKKEEFDEENEDFDEDEFAHLTAAGWVLDNIPTGAEEGSSFEYKNITVTVLSMDGRRINRLIVKINPTEKDEEVQA